MGFNCDFDSVELRLKLLLYAEITRAVAIALPQDFTPTKLTLPPCGTVKEHNLPPFDFWKQRSTV